MLRPSPAPVEILILGAGWTSTFLIPLLKSKSITYAATTTTGHDSTIPFKFDPSSDDTSPYKRLPSAKTVLITFPLTGTGQSKTITSLYRQIHGNKNFWIQLGSTGIFNQCKGWSTCDSPYDKTDARAIAEDELMACADGCVLDLAGLWGGSRVPSTWLPRLAKSKADVKARKSVHFVHGDDVGRAIVGVHEKQTKRKRWIVMDLRVYDWWDLILSFSALTGQEGSLEEREEKVMFGKWVGELMREEGLRALPRPLDTFERKLDGRALWEEIGIWPGHGRLA